ncbi:MAG: M20/M25/M40 family metallo-hydrolase [Christensenellaceae bacterium]|jgi:acetylornithine deacetylase/succinyl-diaminopimelate desuccinylase-like protein|nr:M20/M25/M40 family metallo-hydrolase [Christensenellaceae bacterium]
MQFPHDEALQELEGLILQLCAIPAPSGGERARAEFCRDFLARAGAKELLIDEADNLLLPIGCEGASQIDVLMAHTDTVFPETTPFSPKRRGNRLYCPGVGDDTANLAILLLGARAVLEQGLRPKSGGVLFVADSGEEGLGNLRGIRQVMKDYAGRVRSVVSFDGTLNTLCNWAVGSLRYEVRAKVKGGHSYGHFGSRNAIEALASLIVDLYAIKPPKIGKSKTTYNVGRVSGGTSINSIAQSAKMLYEIRSDHRLCLEATHRLFEDALGRARERKDASFEVTLLGERPCMGDVDPAAQGELEGYYIALSERHLSKRPQLGPGSTDCNIPFSLGIPSLSCGFYSGGGAHTYEEYIELPSLKYGLKMGMEAILHHFKRPSGPAHGGLCPPYGTPF